MLSRASLSLALMMLTALSASDVSAAALSRGQRATILDQLIPAYQQGDSLAVVRVSGPLSRRLNTARVEAIDALLKQHDAPPLGTLMAEARLALTDQDGVSNSPQPNPVEIKLIVPALYTRVLKIIEWAEKHAVMAEPMPAARDFDEFELTLWNTHVLQNQLEATGRLTELIAGWAEKLPPRMLEDLDAEQAIAFRADYEELLARFDLLSHEVQQRDTEIRIRRLEFAAGILAESKNKKERFVAAFALDLDARVIDAFFVDVAEGDIKPVTRERLQDPELAGHLQQIANQGRAHAGDLVSKAQLLFKGIHWWTRGRYGSGPDGWGLLKSMESLKSESDQFSLYMPTETPIPTDPLAGGESVPEYDRRHHYTWGWEDRRIYSAVNTNTTVVSKKNTTVYSMSKFY